MWKVLLTFGVLCSTSLLPVPVSILRIKSVGFTGRLTQSLVYAVIKTFVFISEGEWPVQYKDRADKNYIVSFNSAFFIEKSAYGRCHKSPDNTKFMAIRSGCFN
jgi:hypothetical protein